MQSGGNQKHALSHQSRFIAAKVPRLVSMTPAPNATRNVPRPRAMPFQPQGPMCANPQTKNADEFLLLKIQRLCGADNTECIERLKATYQRQIDPSRETYCFGASATIKSTLRL